jgi:NAD(P)-dependent dehydrogenase (short-subunit alcohol dehydrogenase family)
MFTNKVCVITGGANGIGKAIANEFIKNNAKCYIIDIVEGDHFIGDISDKNTLEQFVKYVIDKEGKIDYLINNAPPITKGINDCSYEDFNKALAIGVTAPFYLSKLFLPYFNDNASIINISSSRDRMSQPQTESYTASKGAISALTHALAISLSHKVRVNSISPGWINTSNTPINDELDHLQHPTGRVGNPLDIANLVLFLCSDKASFINGENICVDGGMTKQMIYHNDYNWVLNNK